MRRRLAELAACVAFAALVACAQTTAAPSQPLSFNHQLHLGLELEGRPLGCVECHAGAERAEHAGLPALSDCLRCHMRPQGGADGVPSANEQRVRELAAAGGAFRWIQVTRNPGHVYASHRAHVGVGGMACETCHGDVTRWSAPPTMPDPGLTSMDRCIECHEQNAAPTECGTCHR
jgi:hypothetical protein